MQYRRKLFMSNDIYNLQATDDIFVGAMRANVAFHAQSCPAYKAFLETMAFDINTLHNISDLENIPPLPTSYLKNNTMLSKPYEKLVLKTTSSGTNGKPTFSGFDISSGLCGLSMLLRVFRYHHLLSLQRTNYIILGYQPDKSNQTAMAKALHAITFFAPAKNITYALLRKDGAYELNLEGLIHAILQYNKQSHPVRIIGFPAYLKLFLKELNNRAIKLSLPTDSKILVGGGWKELSADEISKELLFGMANETLDIRRENFKDHFSTAEHPINYVSCINHHFHIPTYSRVLIRDVRTLQPVPYGTPGLLNLITPLLSSVPYGSIITDDISVMKQGDTCGCGIRTPYFELLGRVGLKSIKTCTQVASDYLSKI